MDNLWLIFQLILRFTIMRLSISRLTTLRLTILRSTFFRLAILRLTILRLTISRLTQLKGPWQDRLTQVTDSVVHEMTQPSTAVGGQRECACTYSHFLKRYYMHAKIVICKVSKKIKLFMFNELFSVFFIAFRHWRWSYNFVLLHNTWSGKIPWIL